MIEHYAREEVHFGFSAHQASCLFSGLESIPLSDGLF
jgi:hypothetical protein